MGELVYVELWRGVPTVPRKEGGYEEEEMLNPPFSFADNRGELGTARNSKWVGGEKRRSGASVGSPAMHHVTSRFGAGQHIPIAYAMRCGGWRELHRREKGEWSEVHFSPMARVRWEPRRETHNARAHREGGRGGLALGRREGAFPRHRASPGPGSLHSSRHILLSSSSHDYDVHMPSEPLPSDPFPGHRLPKLAALTDVGAEFTALRRWKAETIEVLRAWDDFASELIPDPPPPELLGLTKSEALRRLLAQPTHATRLADAAETIAHELTLIRRILDKAM